MFLEEWSSYGQIWLLIFFQFFFFAPQNPGQSFHRQNAKMCILIASNFSLPKHLVGSQSTSTISNFEPQISRLDHLRQLWQSEGRSFEWRFQPHLQLLATRHWETIYESARIYWVSWCSRRIDPFTPAILGIGNVLAHGHSRGKSYSALNSVLKVS